MREKDEIYRGLGEYITQDFGIYMYVVGCVFVVFGTSRESSVLKDITPSGPSSKV